MITQFTPIEAILGGSLIGLSAVLLMAFHGRIAGMTGILAGAIMPKGDAGWRIAFLLGAIAAPVLLTLVTGSPLPFAADFPVWAIVLSGLLVGVGVTFGGGCTSGHGVCGIARLSTRSIVATVTFMATTLITVFVIRHVLGGF
ncbi:YeeE/YedE family protein [Devosia sp. WQ 349]|uniref:YeeE/YedE family protein n=1 Tax=Devosia sp. WQ 349K1 TaxID=2800329 RepID=UPI001902C968|nr:YeeE/YedE thiosulfate transporter family protein [Devosia sp. WQ 349K1]MBK1794220.1 YeeE/YedE family protein [Devosia sp. WQ 349K1]